MCKQTKRPQDNDYQTLQEELEQRYGLGMAQEIIDQIKKAELPQHVPDFMPVKVLSETTETFRGEVKEAVKGLKTAKHLGNYKAKEPTSNVIHLEEERLERDLAHLWECYYASQRAFYTLYHKAIAAYVEEQPARKKYTYKSTPIEMKTVA